LLASGTLAAQQVDATSAVWSEATEISGFAEILILKNVGRCANQPEAHPLFARIARRKGISVEHDHLMCNTMVAVMNDFINSRLPHCLSRAE
jgi:hypothetical protein